MGHGRLLAMVLISALSGLTGCGSGDESTRWKQFPVVVYMDAALAESPEADADFRTALFFWESRAGKRLFEYRGAWTGGSPYAGSPGKPSAIFANVVFLLNPWTFPPNTVGQTVVTQSEEAKIEASIIMINPAASYCSGDCASSNGPSLRKLFAHELGHFLGLGHVSSQNDLMYPDLLPGASLTELSIDIDSLRELTQDDD